MCWTYRILWATETSGYNSGLFSQLLEKNHLLQSTKFTRGMGVAAMFGAASIWGTWVVILSRITLSPVYVTPIIFTVAAVGMTTLTLITRKTTKLSAIVRDQSFLQIVLRADVLEVIQTSAYLIAFSFAIDDGGSVVIPLIRSMAGIITPLLASFAASEKFSSRYLLYGTLSTIGAIMIFSQGGIQLGENLSFIALGLAIFSVVVRAFFYIEQRYMASVMFTRSHHPPTVLTVQLIFSACLLIPFAIIYAMLVPSPPVSNVLRQVMFLAIFGLTHTGFASLLRLFGMRHLNAQQSIIIMYVDPFLSVLLSILFLGEQVTITFFVGAALIIFSAISASLYSAEVKQ